MSSVLLNAGLFTFDFFNTLFTVAGLFDIAEGLSKLLGLVA